MELQNFKKAGLYTLVATLLLCFVPSETNAQHREHRRHAVVKKHRKNKKVVVVRTYKTHPRWRTTVKVVPKGAVVVTHKRINYRFYKGIYYKPVGSSFVVALPPVGIRIKVLPTGHYRFIYRNRLYFYYYGTYYVQTNGGYEVISAPVGARVDTLPDGYEVVEFDGNVYYQVGETYYKAVAMDNGNVLYEVVRV